jgi:hypothetical protein
VIIIEQLVFALSRIFGEYFHKFLLGFEIILAIKVFLKTAVIYKEKHNGKNTVSLELTERNSHP